MEGEETNTSLYCGTEWSLTLSQSHFSPFFLGKFNPQNIFSESEHLTNKEPKVTCEMGLKSTHLI